MASIYKERVAGHVVLFVCIILYPNYRAGTVYLESLKRDISIIFDLFLFLFFRGFLLLFEAIQFLH